MRYLHDVTHPLEELYRKTISNENHKTLALCNHSGQNVQVQLIANGTKYDQVNFDWIPNWIMNWSVYLLHSTTAFADFAIPIDCEAIDIRVNNQVLARLFLLNTSAELVGITIMSPHGTPTLDISCASRFKLKLKVTN